VKISEVHNHGLTLENFIDRYDCIRVQSLINDSFNAIFNAKSTYGRKADIYNAQKMA